MLKIIIVFWLIVLHELFYVFCMVGYTVLAEESATVFCDEHIILYAYASEIFIGLKFVEIKEFRAMSVGLPFVNESWNEVNARLVGHYKTFFEAATHAQAVGAKLLKIGARLFVEAYVDLVESLHVVHIHAHHVSQTVG